MTGIDRGTAASEELVVLLDDQLNALTSMPKNVVHTERTPLHLAFSCYLFDPGGRVLVTRRALAKQTWPGVWANSFCGHPCPGERPTDAVIRRGRQELNVSIDNPRIAIPDFRYRAVDAGGIVENEFCPVWIATTQSQPEPSQTEVSEWHWMEWDDLVLTIHRAPFLFSPWSRLQISQLAAVGQPMGIQ
jgi:isopentenyl-diphosphate Delta-isomerase